jgi:mannitol-1-/sugar-/sorbitol-6-phosphatase
MARAILLDVDGVILDSYQAFRAVWSRWSARHSLHFDTVWGATHGRRPVDTITAVAPHLDSVAEYRSLELLIDDPVLQFPPVAGAQDFLRTIPMGRWGLVTSNDKEKVQERFQANHLLIPKVIVDGHCVAVGKPAPDCYQLGAQLLGAAPAECLVFEDSPAGICAGRKAGCFVVGITTTHPRASLVDAHVIIDTLSEGSRLVREWFGDTDTSCC